MDKISIPSKKDLEIERLKKELEQVKKEAAERTKIHEKAILDLTIKIM